MANCLMEHQYHTVTIDGKTQPSAAMFEITATLLQISRKH